MPTDLTVILQDRPGEIARLGEVAGTAGVSLQGLAAFTGQGRGIVHVLIDDGLLPAARAAFKEAHLGIADEREVLVVDVSDRPGSLGGRGRTLPRGDGN